MTVKETIEIIRESCLWQTLSLKEKAEALAYAMESVGNVICSTDENVPEILDVIR